MARSVKKPTARKPVAKARKPQAPKAPDTKEDLLRQIGALLDEVETKVEQRRGNDYVFFGRWGGLTKDLSIAAAALSERLDKLLNPDNRAGLPGAPEAIAEAFGATPGTVPSWSRPGTFLLWIDYVPCRCIWGGFIDAGADVVAADPKGLWMSPAGSISVSREIEARHRTVADLFRHRLTEKTTDVSYANTRRRTYNSPGEPAFNLLRLSQDGRQAAEQTLAQPEFAWLVEALKRGPVKPIPLPPHLQAVQISLFG